MAIREGRWDCPGCGSRSVYGRHVDCPGCGKPRPAGTRFYLTDDAPVITDAAQLAEANAGADWICGHCGASTRATQTDCGGCGVARGTSPTQPVIHYGPGQVPRAGGTPGTAPAAGLSAGPAASNAEDWTCTRCGQSNPPGKTLCRRCHKGKQTTAARRRRMSDHWFAFRERLELYAVTLLVLLPILFVGWMVVSYLGRSVGSGGGYRYEASEWGTRTGGASEGESRTGGVSEGESRIPEASGQVETGAQSDDHSTDLGNGYFDDRGQ
jgi:ribosomal protein L40E